MSRLATIQIAIVNKALINLLKLLLIYINGITSNN